MKAKKQVKHKKHCSTLKNATAFVRGLQAGKAKSYKNAHIKKKKNKDGSYLVTWTVYWRV